MPFVVGDAVTFAGAPGIGRVGESGTGMVRVDFFESAAEPIADSVWKSERDVRLVRLEEETRVFFKDARDRWRAGRVVGARDDYYFVKVPNVHSPVEIDGWRLFVRWDRVPKDPLQVLLSGANETPRYRDAREPVRSLLLKERAATASATGVMSAGVRMHAHQISAALRIIRDPVQRYLLADEVGMGKTIQAGLVMRQLLIDEPGSRIGVIVPDALIAQWRSELRDKFHLDDFPTVGGTTPYEIVGHDDVAGWNHLADVDLLVVDEAHVLAKTDGPRASPYRELTEIAHAAPRVLMLSATPFARGAQTHLALLHLLDPQLFRWEDEERFTALLAARRDLALAVFGLDPEPDPDNPELLDLQFREIRDRLPDDEALHAAMARAMAVFDVAGGPETVAEDELRRAVDVVRTHISETYRLHHRVIRNRRHEVAKQKLDDDGLLTPFEFTGRTRPKVVVTRGAEEVASGARGVLDWATRCAAAILDDGLDPSLYGPVLGILVSRIGGPIRDLANVLAYRVDGEFDSLSIGPTERAHLDRAPLLGFESSVLTAVRSVEHSDSLKGLAAELAKVRAPARAVVFCGRGHLAADLLVELQAALGSSKNLHGHLAGQSEPEREAAADAWRTAGGVLVVDDSGEVGRNFQDATLAFHVRLPWNPNALEQRIGRVDRYGNQRAARQYVFGDGDPDSLPSTWRRVLEDGFRIFDDSISAYQEVADESAVRAWSVALVGGVEALLARIEPIRDELSAERKRVNELDALESSFGTRGDGEKMAMDIARFEARPEDIEASYLNLASSPEGFKLKASRNKDGSLRFERDPADQPLFSPRLLRRLMSVEVARTGYFDRWRLTPGRRLFRRGNPFVNGLESLLSLDDRGQAVALWRWFPQWPNDPFTFFGFDFVVEADLAPILQLLGEGSRFEPVARRRADAAFAPQGVRVWVSAHSEEPINGDGLVAFLDQPFRPTRGDKTAYIDQNLNHERIGALHILLGGEENLAPVAHACFDSALTQVKVTANVIEASARAVAKVQGETEVILAQSRARSRAAGLVSDPAAFEDEVTMGRAIEAGVAEPVVRLAGVSCVVVSAQPWKSYVSG